MESLQLPVMIERPGDVLSVGLARPNPISFKHKVNVRLSYIGTTLKELCRDAGEKPGGYSKVLNGHSSLTLRQIERFGELLGVEPESLMTDDWIQNFAAPARHQNLPCDMDSYKVVSPLHLVRIRCSVMGLKWTHLARLLEESNEMFRRRNRDGWFSCSHNRRHDILGILGLVADDVKSPSISSVIRKPFFRSPEQILLITSAKDTIF